MEKMRFGVSFQWICARSIHSIVLYHPNPKYNSVTGEKRHFGLGQLCHDEWDYKSLAVSDTWRTKKQPKKVCLLKSMR